MSTDWPKVRLGDVLRRSAETVIAHADKDYRQITVKLWGKGAVLRGMVSGGSVNGRRFIARAGQLILSRIDARNGAIAVVPNDLDGALVTNDFPVFDPDPSELDVSFLGWLARTRSFVELCLRASEGTTNRVRLQQDRFLRLEMSLPSLAEQRRIVARIEELAAKIAEARSLRQVLSGCPDEVFLAAIELKMKQLRSECPSRPLIKLVHADRGISYGIVQTGEPFEAGIPTLRAGDLHQFHVAVDEAKQVDPHIEAKYRRTRLEGNEVLLRIRGGLGEVAVCPRGMVGGNVSREIAVIPLKADVDPYFMMYAIAAASSQDFLRRHVRGTSYVGINLIDVRRLEVPVPPIQHQRRIVAYLDGLQAQVDALKRLQAETAAELDALLPSILDRAFKGEL
jgi:type I restriction enzyme S subunit